MRVLLINYEYPPVGGGASNATWEIARAMVQLGHQPVVLTAKYRWRTPDTANPGIKVIEVPAIRRRKDRCSIFEMTTFVLSATWCIRKILKAEKIEGMIAFFSIPCGPIAWWGWRKTKIPYVVSLRGGDVPGNEPTLNVFHVILRPLRRTIFRGATKITSNSKGLKHAAESADNIQVYIIPNGIDTGFWRRASPHSDVSPRRLLFVGRFQRQKNLRWLLNALAEMPPPDDLPPWELHLVGDGPERDELETLANALGLCARVCWHGWADKHLLKTIYDKSDVFISPALYEGLPNAMLEAMACELLVLASDVAGHSELIEHEETGLLFTLESSLAFKSALTRALAGSDFAKSTGKKARASVCKNNSWTVAADEYTRILQR